MPRVELLVRPCRHGHPLERSPTTGRCLPCLRERNARWRDANPEKEKQKGVRWKGENPDLDRKHKRDCNRRAVERKATRPRPEVCEVCAQPPEGAALHWDHDHETGAFRGWLCARCNHALGHAKDNPATLRALADYAEKHAAKPKE